MNLLKVIGFIWVVARHLIMFFVWSPINLWCLSRNPDLLSKGAGKLVRDYSIAGLISGMLAAAMFFWQAEHVVLIVLLVAIYVILTYFPLVYARVRGLRTKARQERNE